MAEALRSKLLETDWNAEWMRLARARRRADVPAAWDARARHFRPRETAPYARDFIRLMELLPGESVLDMGCGGGSIAIPLARAGHPVIAADFSPAMLETVRAGAAHHGVEAQVQARALAWADDWEAAGLAAKSVDVAIASRSIATENLLDALMKLDRAARRRCCVTLVTGASPRLDTTVMDAIGAAYTSGRDYVYAFNILVGAGVAPAVSYIDSPRRDTFDSLEAGVADFSRMLEGGNEDRVDELRAYIETHMVPNPHAGEHGPKGLPQGRYMLDHVRIVRWAFISWEPQGSTI